MKNTDLNHSLQLVIEQEPKLNSPIIHVFKTNVEGPRLQAFIIEMLYSHFPDSVVSLDLDDCDKVLCIKHDSVPASAIIYLLNMYGFNCSELQD